MLTRRSGNPVRQVVGTILASAWLPAIVPLLRGAWPGHHLHDGDSSVDNARGVVCLSGACVCCKHADRAGDDKKKGKNCLPSSWEDEIPSG
jgi:hypothetical protein